MPHHQMEANLAAEQAQQLHERLLNAQNSANIVFAPVEAEASRSRNETSARDGEISRMKSEMQEMMRIQQQGMELLEIDNETLRRRFPNAGTGEFVHVRQSLPPRTLRTAPMLGWARSRNWSWVRMSFATRRGLAGSALWTRRFCLF